MKSAEILSKQLRELREECNIPQADFAEMLGISRAHLARLEGGEAFSTLKVLDRLPSIIHFVLKERIRLIFRFSNGETMNLDEVAEWIVKRREKDFQTQQDYSLTLGLPTSTISRFERDKLNSVKKIAQIAEAHGATLEIEKY